MDECVGCGSATVSERSECTAQGYRRFRCRACGKPSASVLSALVPASIAGSMEEGIFQAACNTVNTVAERRRKWNLRQLAETC
jgi:hypothetical protein